MSRKTIFGMLLTLLLASTLTLAFDIRPANALAAVIYIRSDGSVEGTKSIASDDNMTYIFAADIQGSIVGERSNIIIDGNGHTLQGFQTFGYYLYGIENVTIQNTNIKGFQEGVCLNYSSFVNVSRNNITNNVNFGLDVWSSSNNILIENNITNNGDGIYMVNSTSNMLRHNTMNGNVPIRYGWPEGYNFLIDGWDLEDYINDVDTTNTIDGAPIYYWVNKQGLTVPSDAGYVAIINSTNVAVKNLNLTKNGQGVLFVHTNDSSIVGNNLEYNQFGLWFRSSSNNIISQNNITNNAIGAFFWCSSRNTLSQNNIENSWIQDGVYLYCSSGNTLTANKIANNHYCGVRVVNSSSNSIYHNNFTDNEAQVYVEEPSSNKWDDGYPSGGNCWSDYRGTDLYSGPYQNETGEDGVCDHPYIIDEKNMDRYPLVTQNVAQKRFSPIIDGFQFSNNQFTLKTKESIEKVAEDFESSQLAQTIPRVLWPLFEYPIQAIGLAQKGYCGGMTYTAEQYFNHPDQLPSGYTNTHDIDMANQETMYQIIYHQWVTQFLEDDYYLKWWLLRLGDDPCGLVPFDKELEWIMSELDKGKPVELTLFDVSWNTGREYFMGHAVLAYDYKEVENDIDLYIYGPNYGNTTLYTYQHRQSFSYTTGLDGGQRIHLTKDADGNYEIVDWADPDYKAACVEGFKITRLGSTEAPTWGLGWSDVLSHVGEILPRVKEFLVSVGTSLLSIIAESPVNLLVTASNGLRVGYDAKTGTVVNEIKGAMFSGTDAEPQMIIIPDSLKGNYSISLTGKGTGSYKVTIESTNSYNNITSTITYDGLTYLGKLDTYPIELQVDGNIIPEFPPFLLLALSMIATLLAMIVYRREARRARLFTFYLPTT
jgi:parallel beta-helix repeat protein